MPGKPVLLSTARRGSLLRGGTGLGRAGQSRLRDARQPWAEAGEGRAAGGLGSGPAAQRTRGLFWAAGRKLAVLLAAALGYRPAAGASDPTSAPRPGRLFLSSALFPRRPQALWVGPGEGPWLEKAKRGSRAHREMPTEVTSDGQERSLPIPPFGLEASWRRLSFLVCRGSGFSLCLWAVHKRAAPLVTPLPPCPGQVLGGKQQMPAGPVATHLGRPGAPGCLLRLRARPSSDLVAGGPPGPPPRSCHPGLPNPTTGPLHDCFLPGISISQPSCSCPPPRAAPCPRRWDGPSVSPRQPSLRPCDLSSGLSSLLPRVRLTHGSRRGVLLPTGAFHLGLGLGGRPRWALQAGEKRACGSEPQGSDWRASWGSHTARNGTREASQAPVSSVVSLRVHGPRFSQVLVTPGDFTAVTGGW